MRTQARTSAVLELTIADAFWGFGFIAATWALRSMGPLAITGWRFFLAAMIGYGLMSFRKKTRREQYSLEQLKLAVVPGLLIGLSLVLQTWGLQYTTATKSAFITSLYVLLVPLFETTFLKRKLPRYHLVYVGVALIGVLLICDLASLSTAATSEDLAKLRPNFGDLLTIGCALAATLQIVWFGLIAKKIGSSFAFNNSQSLVAGIIPLLLSFVLEPMPNPNWQDLSLQGLLMLTFGSTLIAFALQVRAQKHISPSIASLLFLLESPFSAFFAIFFLGENLKALQWTGGALIMVAAALSVIFQKEVAEAPPLEPQSESQKESQKESQSET